MRPHFCMIWNELDDRAARFASDLSSHIRPALVAPEYEFSTSGLSVFDLSTGAPSPSITTVLGQDGLVNGAVFGSIFGNIRLSSGTYGRARFTQDACQRLRTTNGDSIFQDFWGSYVAFIKIGELTAVLCEPTASIPCYVTHRHGVTLVFSHLEKCGFLDRSIFSINYEFLSQLLVYDKIQNGKTGLNEVTELLGGQRLLVSDSGLSTSQIWDPRVVAKCRDEPDLETAAVQLRETCRSVVRTRAAQFSKVTVNTSGGLDSTIVLCSLGTANRHFELGALHHAFDSEGSSEEHFAREAASFVGLELETARFSPERSLPDLLTHPLTVRPFRQFLGVGFRRNLREASSVSGGAEFTGQGGDHLFLDSRSELGFADYVRRNGLTSSAMQQLVYAARLSQKSIWEVLRVTFPECFKRVIRKDVRQSLARRRTRLNTALYDTLDFDAAFPAWALSSDRLEPAKFQQVYSLLHMGQMRDPFDEESSTELVHPLISQPLVELCLQIPTYILCHAGESRGLVRRAFADKIPESIRRRMTKGSVSEYFSSVLAYNMATILEHLRAGELVKAGLIDSSILNAFVATNEHRTASYGRMLLFCYAMEAWLRRWRETLGCQRSPPHPDVVRSRF